MKTVCIYHSIDLDGWMSAAIVKHWYDNKPLEINPHKMEVYPEYNLDFIGYNYGQPIPDLSEYDKVIMCDISFPSEEMLELEKKLDSKFIWIDHHFGAFETMKKDIVDYSLHPFQGLQDTKFAACELTWQYFFPNETMPEIVRLLGRYDCFGHKGTDEERKVLEFQYGARQVISNMDQAYEYLKVCDNYSNRDKNYEQEHFIWEQGKAIYQYLCTEAKQSYRNGFMIEFDNPNYIKRGAGGAMLMTSANKKVAFICINKERFNPINFGIDYHKEGYDGAACFHYAKGKWNFSLYNDNGLVDCSIIAKQFGGGGHKGASGFVIDNIDSLKELLSAK